MQLNLTTREVPSLVCHFARRSPEKALGLLGDWTKDRYATTREEIMQSQKDMQDGLKLAALRLNVNSGSQVEPTRNGMLTQGFEGGRLVAIPAICGMVAPALLALYDDKTAKAFQYRDGDLVEAKISNPGNKRDVGINLGEHSKATVGRESLNLVVNDYSNHGTSRVTLENSARQKTTFTSMSGGDSMKTMVIDSQLKDSYVYSGSARFNVTAPDNDTLALTFLPGSY